MRHLALLAALAALVPAGALAEPPTPDAAAWKGTVGAGLIVMTGNARTTMVTGNAVAARESLGWIWTAKAWGAYGRNRAAAAGAEVSADNAALQLRLDRKYGALWTVYLLGGVEADHVASVELRDYGELGVGALWVDVKEKDFQWVGLRTDLGFRYTTEKRWQYYGEPATRGPLPGADVYAPRLGLVFRYAFSKDVWFAEEVEFLPGVLAARSRYQTKSLSKLSARVSSNVTTGVSYLVVDDSRPADAKLRTDTTLTATIDLSY